ncbi:MAG: hypothetical protein WD042_18850 [Phycisphaeraceae bacterium]
MSDAVRTGLFAGVLIGLLLWESLQPFFDLFGRSTRSRAGHLLRNMTLAAVNAAAVALVFVTFWTWAAWYSQAHGFGVLHRLPQGCGLTRHWRSCFSTVGPTVGTGSTIVCRCSGGSIACIIPMPRWM